MKTVLVSAVALIDSDGRILLAQRPLGKSMAGLWEFPGGKVEKGETQYQALKREIKEEIDYDLIDPKQLIITTHQYESFRLTLDVWYEKSKQPQVHANENQPIKWIHKSQLKNINFPEADAPIVNAILNLKNL